MSKVRAIVFSEHGAPAEVARLGEVELPEMSATSARVRVLAAPINPADLNTIEGKYPIVPELPGVPGVEGVGVVEEIGAEVRRVKVGDRVLLPHGLGTWREAGIMPAEDLMVVPPGIATEQAAMLKINPATALRMLADFVQLAPGDWILQNAANSGVGRAVIQIAKVKGLNTVNFVRRPELIPELQKLGANLVLLDEGDPRAGIEDAHAGEARLALNAVGGESALRLAKALSRGGTIVTYGAMGRKPLSIPNGSLIFQLQTWTGFWVSQWYRTASVTQRDTMLAEIFSLAESGVLHTPVARIFPLEDAAKALAIAQEGGRAGKILFGAPEVIAGFSPE